MPTIRHEKKRSLGDRDFSPMEIRQQLRAAGSAVVEAWILLAVNCGFGVTDLISIRWADLDLDGGWYDSLRHKTAIPRRAKLWPQQFKWHDDRMRDRL
jgi:integrase